MTTSLAINQSSEALPALAAADPLAGFLDAISLPAAPPTQGSFTSWAARRLAALQQYQACGFPTARTERWQYSQPQKLATRLAAIATIPATAAVPPPHTAASIAPEDAVVISYRQGRWQLDDDIASKLGAGVQITLCPAAELDHHQAPAEWADRLLDQLPMAAANCLLAPEILLIELADHSVAVKPLLLDMAIGAGFENPRVMLRCGADASLQLYQRLEGGSAQSCLNGVSDIFLAPGARLAHYRHLDLADDAMGVWSIGAVVSHQAQYETVVVQTGAALMREEIQVSLAGKKASATIKGGYLAAPGQILDNSSLIIHDSPDTQSQELFKGIVAVGGRGVFQGKIKVQPGAQKTDGRQLNRALLLGPGAEVDSKPELEIYADDVQCSHGATIGDLDDTQLFYLLARGIDEKTARALLMQAFIADVVDGVGDVATQVFFQSAIDAKLTQMVEL